MAAVVGNVAGGLFIAETLLRKDDGPGRLWSVAFLSGMATTLAYSAWAAGIGGMVAVALGNALFVNTAAWLWLGCRAFNSRSNRAAMIAVGVLVALVALAVLLEGPDGGDWAGWPAMALALVALTAVAAFEIIRRPLGRNSTARVLAVVFILVSLFYCARFIAYFLAPSLVRDDDGVLGVITASFVTVVFTIVGVVVTSVLRATRADLRSYAWMSDAGVAADGILLAPTFGSWVRDLVERASWRSDLLIVIAVRLEDLGDIRKAFGATVAGEVVDAWRQGVRRFAPSTAIVGEDGPNCLMVVTRASTAAEARRQAATIYRGLFEALRAVETAVIPAAGVGVAMTETVGYDAASLLRAARGASARALTSVESSVLFGGVDEVLDDLR